MSCDSQRELFGVATRTIHDVTSHPTPVRLVPISASLVRELPKRRQYLSVDLVVGRNKSRPADSGDGPDLHQRGTQKGGFDCAQIGWSDVDLLDVDADLIC